LYPFGSWHKEHKFRIERFIPVTRIFSILLKMSKNVNLPWTTGL